MITGGYAETDVWVTIEIRGIDVPRALQVSEGTASSEWVSRA